MRNLLLAAAAGIALLAGTPAQAGGYVTGNQMLDACERDRSSCIVYAAGWRAGHTTTMNATMAAAEMDVTGMSWADVAMNVGSIVCLPDTVSNGQMADVLVQWLHANPQHRHLAVSVIAYAAFATAWPCNYGQPS